MRPKIQAAVISTQLEFLQERLNHLETVVVHGRKVFESGRSWLVDNEENHKSFCDMQLVLSNEISAVSQLEIKEEITDPCQQRNCAEDRDCYSEIHPSLESGQSLSEINKKLEDFISTCTEKETNYKIFQTEILDKLKDIDQQLSVITESTLQETRNQLATFTSSIKMQIDCLSNNFSEIKSSRVNSEMQIKRLEEKALEFDNLLQYLTDNIENKEKEQKTASEKVESVTISIANMETKFKDDYLSVERKHDDLTKQITVFNEDFDKLKTKFYQIEKSSNTVGFSAYSPEKGYILELEKDININLNCFTDVKCNIGNHFDSNTGIFKAPCGGLYFVCLVVRAMTDFAMKLNVMKKNCSNEIINITSCGCSSICTNSCSVMLTELEAGDELFVSSAVKIELALINPYNLFACFKIN